MARKYRPIQVGDMVLPIDEREFLFATPNEIKFEADPIEVFWDTIPGIVIEIQQLDPPQDYYQVKIIVGDIIGWTYSDYIEVI